MGHHWLPVPSNFPTTGHQVRHSTLVTVKCLSTSPCWHGDETTRSLWKGCRSPNNKWSLNWVLAANRGRSVGSCSAPAGSLVWEARAKEMTASCHGMTGRGGVCEHGVDHACRCGIGGCLRRDPAWLQITWPLCGHTPTRSTNGPSLISCKASNTSRMCLCESVATNTRSWWVFC